MQVLSNQSNSRIFISGENDLYHFDLKGNLLEKFSFSVDLVESQAYPFDILGDDQEEILIMNSNGVYFTDYQLKDLAFLPFSEAIYSPFQISVKNKTRNSGVVSINNNAVQYEMKFALDPLYFWRHPIWFAVYLSVVLLLWLTQLLQKKQSQQKYEAERQLMAFRFRALKNQVDPHFTLNALNSIAQMQEQGQQERAGKFLVKFSRMIHRTLENSDKIETTLEEELDFVSDYLDVQQMRFRNSFSFEIKLEDEALSELPVPRHLVHTFVENALKHGLRPLEFPGRLIINVYRERKNVIIEVDDNGIGREEAANSKSLSTGKGLKILDELITLFEKLNKCQISYEIIDKKDEQGKPSGTKVLIKIPDHEG